MVASRAEALMWLWLAGAAFADEWQAPNSVIGVSVGTPTTLSLRGEAWLADSVEGELGIGFAELGNIADTPPSFDWAVRWRPDFACFGCGTRVLGTLGVGAGGVLAPPPGFDGPWGMAVGPDLGGNLVYWVSNRVGLHLSGRVGFGPTFLTNDIGADSWDAWAFLSAGVAF